MVPVGTNISIAFGVVFYGFSIYIRQDAARAAVTALGPGMGTTSASASIATRTALKPGSDMVRVPASVTKATESPSSRRFRNSSARFASLPRKYEVAGANAI
jgi:hypothetical protein